MPFGKRKQPQPSPTYSDDLLIITDADLASLTSAPSKSLVPFNFANEFVMQPELNVLTISLDDLAADSDTIITIEEGDLPAIITLRPEDLPEVVKIHLQDLPSQVVGNEAEFYHGTSWDIAERIKREGFMVGPGAAIGSGIYFSVGNLSIARGYAKSARPCIIRSRVHFGKVCYLDDPANSAYHGSGDSITRKALNAGFHTFLQTKKYSKDTPTIGVVLGTQGSYIKPPRIEVIELIDPHKQKD